MERDDISPPDLLPAKIEPPEYNEVEYNTNEPAKTIKIEPVSTSMAIKLEPVSPTTNIKLEPVSPTIDMNYEPVYVRFDTVSPAMNIKYEPISPTMDNKYEAISPPMDVKLEAVSPSMNSKYEPISPAMDVKYESISPMDVKYESISPAMDTKYEAVSPAIDVKLETISPSMDIKYDPISPAIEMKFEPVSPPINFYGHGIESEQRIPKQKDNEYGIRDRSPIWVNVSPKQNRANQDYNEGPKYMNYYSRYYNTKSEEDSDDSDGSDDIDDSEDVSNVCKNYYAPITLKTENNNRDNDAGGNFYNVDVKSEENVENAFVYKQYYKPVEIKVESNITDESKGTNYNKDRISPSDSDSSNDGLRIATDVEDEEEVEKKPEEKANEQPEENFQMPNNTPDGTNKQLEIVDESQGSAPAQDKIPAQAAPDDNNVPNESRSPAPREAAQVNSSSQSIPAAALALVPAVAPPLPPVMLPIRCSDAEGFYNVQTGEILASRYLVYYVAGKGAFSNVVRARDYYHRNSDVAIKVIRKHPAMFKMGLKELEVYKKLRLSDRDDFFHCLRFRHFFVHKRHLCLVLEPMSMNLSYFINMRGKDSGGLDLRIVEYLVPQLFLALKLLRRNNIIHADIKPDNILINHMQLRMKLGDFGSALTGGYRVQTPYLVSRYYRSPEIIMGSGYDHGIDIWASGCSIYEMATGKKMFKAVSNNHMLRKIMEYSGKIPKKMMKRGEFTAKHFNAQSQYIQITNEDTEQEISTVIPRIKKRRNLQAEITPPPPILLTRAQDRKCRQLRDLLGRMLCVDPDLRAPIDECLGHRFSTY